MDNENSNPIVNNCSFIGNTAGIRGCVVDFKDLAILCGNWLAGNEPEL
jgi:hypothetical protein